MSDRLPVPPGWYPDPAAPGECLRWWDGGSWKDACATRAACAAEGTTERTTVGAHWPEPPGAPGSPGSPGSPSPVIPARAGWWALAGLLIGELLGLLLVGITSLATGRATGAATTLVGEIGLWSGMFGAAWFVSRRYGTNSLRRDFSLAIKPRDLWIGFAAAVAGLVVSDLVGAAFAHSRFQGTNTQIITGQKHNGPGFAAVALIVAVGAPFFEELFFRGLIRTALASRLGTGGAVWAQAACFGLAHYVVGNGWGNVSVVIAIAALGVVLGYTARWTGRLGAGMIAHGLFNTVVTVVLLTS